MRVLIVEDHADDRKILKLNLEHHGCEVFAAVNGQQALELARAERLDLIISDALMPVMDGYELLRQLQADDELANIPFIFYSAVYTEKEEQELALALGAAAFVVKPLEPKMLWQRLKDILNGGSLKSVGETVLKEVDDVELLHKYSRIVATKLEEKVRELETAKSAILTERNYYQNVFTSIRDVLVIADLERRIVEVNQPACREIYGYETAELVGQKSSILYADEDSFAAAGKKIFDKSGGIQPTVFEMPMRRKNGATFVAEISAFKVLDKNGVVTHNGSIIRDITLRKEAQKALAEARDEWQLTFDAISDIVTVQDLDHRLLRINRATARLLEIDPEEAIGQYCYELFRGSPEPCPDCAIPDISNPSMDYSGEIYNQKFNKTLLSTVSPLKDSDGTVRGVVHFAKDITEQKKLENQLTQSQKMEAIGTLAGGISHDFNNILTGIIGYTEMAETVIPPDHPGQEYLKQVLKGTARATKLIQQIMTFSRQSAPEKKPLHFEKVLREALKLLRSSLPSSIIIEEEIADNCGIVIGDTTQIHQVIMNLATNARQAMEKTDSGIIRVVLQPFIINPEDRALFSGLEAGEYLKLEVCDSGPGMEKELIEKIFDPYFTTKEQGKGTGLGLAVVHGIVKDHGGAIMVYSEPGKGTSFIIILPTQSKVDEELSTKKKIELPRGRERIIVVDDEETIAKIEKRLLEQLGYQVTDFSSSRKAFQAFQERPDAFDLILTDMTMPEMNGVELAKKILGLRPDMPIVIASGFSPLINEDSARSKGIREYISKPFKKLELAEKIRKALDEPG